MHGAALATANPAFLAEELTHHRFGIGAFGDGVAVATMVARDLVAPAQVTANTRRDRFLSNGEMRRALHQIFFGTADHHTFESTDTAHRGIKVEDALRRGGFCSDRDMAMTASFDFGKVHSPRRKEQQAPTPANARVGATVMC